MTTFTDTEMRIAQAFHEAYEELAPMHGYKTREESAVPWEDVPDTNKHLMCSTVHLLLRRGVIAPAEKQEQH